MAGPAGPVGAGEVWARVLGLAASRPTVSVVVGALSLEGLEGGVAVLTSGSAAHLSSARSMKPAIEGLLSEAAGRTVRAEIRAPEAAAAEAPAAVDSALRAQAMRNPLVRRAVELFDARLVEVKEEGMRDEG